MRTPVNHLGPQQGREPPCIAHFGITSWTSDSTTSQKVFTYFFLAVKSHLPQIEELSFDTKVVLLAIR